MQTVTSGTTQLRLLLANVIADVGAMREVITQSMRADDRAYLELEVDRLQAAAHRLVAFLDDVADHERQ